ncbi:aladin-like isoform X2 [Bacillus rossius redtenbacheri]|uniref:aladin-like isoform X2 n=1 Tax=Bacillus rossius redtenbacheri TaxID=93214 RepID=UPI002FDD70EF
MVPQVLDRYRPEPTEGGLVSAVKDVLLGRLPAAAPGGRDPCPPLLKVAITRELLHASLREAVGPVFAPTSETVLKRVISTWWEQGLQEALELAASLEGEAPALGWLARGLLKVGRAVSRVRGALHPHLLVAGEGLAATVSETRDWVCGPVRGLAWHPHCTKLAVATVDDAVRIYSSDLSFVPVLKLRTQRSVSCMQWRPFSASELAVGCERGVYVWSLDPTSVATRPSASCATFLRHPDSCPVTGLAWSPQGDVLLTCSPASTTMFAWDVERRQFSAVRRRVGGGGVCLVSWSPDSCRVFSASTSVVFRVWETALWTDEVWKAVSGRVRSACWSPCGSVLLFATSDDPKIFSLTYGAAAGCGEEARSATSVLPVIDLTLAETEQGVRVGGIVSSMQWDARGHFLAVLFLDSPLIAVFSTCVLPTRLHVSPCCLINGIRGEIPNVMSFQKNFEEGSLLTVAWSSGRVQQFPFLYVNYPANTSGHYQMPGAASPCD